MDIVSPVKVLYDYYAESQPITSERIWQCSRRLLALLQGLPSEEQEQIMNAAALLVESHEQEAFYAGLRVGVRLSHELENLLPYSPKAKQGE